MHCSDEYFLGNTLMLLNQSLTLLGVSDMSLSTPDTSFLASLAGKNAQLKIFLATKCSSSQSP